MSTARFCIALIGYVIAVVVVVVVVVDVVSSFFLLFLYETEILNAKYFRGILLNHCLSDRIL